VKSFEAIIFIVMEKSEKKIFM